MEVAEILEILGFNYACQREVYNVPKHLKDRSAVDFYI